MFDVVLFLSMEQMNHGFFYVEYSCIFYQSVLRSRSTNVLLIRFVFYETVSHFSSENSLGVFVIEQSAITQISSDSMNISSYRASSLQRKGALAVVLVVLVITILTLPWARVTWPTIQPFLPAYIAGVLILDLVTAYVLFTEFLVIRKPALSVLASGYLFSALITVPHILSFPGVFNETGLFGAGTQTAVWLWVFWHGGFPLFIIANMLVDFKLTDKQLSQQRARYLVGLMIALVILIVFLLALVAYRYGDLLPKIIEKGNFNILVTSGVGPFIWVLNAAACLALFWLKRGKTVLTLWLNVAALAFLLDVTLTLFAGARYSSGWYVARLTSFFSAGIVLGTMLYELRNLYSLAATTNDQRMKQATEMINLNKQLIQEKAHIQHIMETVQEGKMLYEASAGILYANARMNELLKTNSPLIEAKIIEWLQRPDKEFKERLLLVSEQKMRHFEVYVLATHEEGTSPSARFHIFVFRDRTEEEKIEQIKNEFVSVVSHELRTPLTSILGFVELMLNRELQLERQRKYLTTVHKETTRLSVLINDFLDIQRMESGKQTFQFEPTDLNIFLHEIVQQWQGNSCFQIGLSVSAAPVWVDADQDRLHQVFDNLISNAIKYSPGRDRIDIQLSMAQEQAYVEVRDYGLGIPEESKDMLFSKFYRVDNSDRRKIGGTGLGLSIVKEIVEAHNGKLLFESEHGNGSVFTVVLPTIYEVS